MNVEDHFSLWLCNSQHWLIKMFLSNKTLLFLIIILINKFSNGETISKPSDRKSKKMCDKYLNEKEVLNDLVFGGNGAINFPHNVSYW